MAALRAGCRDGFFTCRRQRAASVLRATDLAFWMHDPHQHRKHLQFVSIAKSKMPAHEDRTQHFSIVVVTAESQCATGAARIARPTVPRSCCLRRCCRSISAPWRGAGVRGADGADEAGTEARW